MVCIQLGAQWCDIAVDFNQFNSMDFIFQHVGWLFCHTGMKCTFQGVAQVQVQGGASTGTDTDFDFSGNSGGVHIDSFRSESGTSAGLPPVVLGGGNGDHVTISHSTFRQTTEYTATSILIDNGFGLYTFEHNSLVGSIRHIQGSHVIKAHQNGIWVQNGDRFLDADPGTWIGQITVDAWQNFLPSQINGFWLGSMHPDAHGVMTGADLHYGNYPMLDATPTSAEIQAAVDRNTAATQAIEDAVATEIQQLKDAGG
jgi:hypothetical protein